MGRRSEEIGYELEQAVGKRIKAVIPHERTPLMVTLELSDGAQPNLVHQPAEVREAGAAITGWINRAAGACLIEATTQSPYAPDRAYRLTQAGNGHGIPARLEVGCEYWLPLGDPT